MASVNKDSKGWRVIYYDSAKQKKQIRLGKFNKKQAQLISSRVESILSAQSSGAGLDRETAQWLATISPELHQKLVNVGLVQPRSTMLLDDFIEDYKAKRVDTKGSTQLKWRSAQRKLVAFFGAKKNLREINSGEADEFRLFLLGQGLEENSVRRYCGIAKQFFGAAVKRKLIEENPFSGVVAAVTGNADKFYFLSRSDADKILEVCPDLQWKLIFVLTRFGGLRIPSELFQLKWSDIDWDGGKMTVRSPKTEHHKGKASRLVPIFPELRGLLKEAVDANRGKDGFVVPKCQNAVQNFRTTFQKIVKRAGLKPWAKLFQNLRSTRQTELCEQFPSHVVSAWIGNSESVAKRHYLQVTEDHFQRASGLPSVVAEVVATPVATKAPEPRRIKPYLRLSRNEKSREIRGYSSGYVTVPLREMGAEGLEPERNSPKKKTLIEHGGNTSGNIAFRNHLAGVVSLFTRLDHEGRKEVLAFAQTMKMQQASE